MSQTGSIALPVYVQPANPNARRLPPWPSARSSAAGANMTFDATGCTDAETPPAALTVRWTGRTTGRGTPTGASPRSPPTPPIPPAFTSPRRGPRRRQPDRRGAARLLGAAGCGRCTGDQPAACVAGTRHRVPVPGRGPRRLWQRHGQPARHLVGDRRGRGRHRVTGLFTAAWKPARISAPSWPPGTRSPTRPASSSPTPTRSTCRW